MKVFINNINNIQNSSTQKSSKKHTTITNTKETKDIFYKQPNFCGFESKIMANSLNRINNATDLERIFTVLFNEIESNPKIKKTEYFNIIKDLYNTKGLRETLSTLGKRNEKGALGKFIEDAAEYDLTLASINSRPVMSIHNAGTYGVLNTLTDSSSAKREMRLTFQDPKGIHTLDFSLGKNSEYEIRRSNRTRNYYNSYYPTTGNMKKEVVSKNLIDKETTYYNEDGTKSFFKNLFLGSKFD